MDFCSMLFIVCFLPLFLLVYYLTPPRYRNDIIFIGSLIAYGVQCLKWLPVLLVLVAVNYLFYRILAERKKHGKSCKALLWIIVAGNLAALICSKCLEEGMPGISFFVFCALAFQIDIYREKKKKRPIIGFVEFGAYMTFFPKLLSGPITRWDKYQKGLPRRQRYKGWMWHDLEEGLVLFITGLGYKVLLANSLAGMWSEIAAIGYENVSTALAWAGMFAYSMELYFDFHGYSMMAMGVAGMMGIELPRNFWSPYGSKSVSEFYRRWHSTLGEWFKDYVYIPLGGNRQGRLRTVRNLAIVWVLTGLWHGIGYNFLLWAGILLAFILLERTGLRKWLDKWPVAGHLYVWLVIPLSMMPFALHKWHDVIFYFGSLFGRMGPLTRLDDVWTVGYKYVPYLLAALLLALPAWKRRGSVESDEDKVPWVERWLMHRAGAVVRAVLLALIFWWSVYKLSVGSVNPFMYFAF